MPVQSMLGLGEQAEPSTPSAALLSCFQARERFFQPLREPSQRRLQKVAARSTNPKLQFSRFTWIPKTSKSQDTDVRKPSQTLNRSKCEVSAITNRDRARVFGMCLNMSLS